MAKLLLRVAAFVCLTVCGSALSALPYLSIQ